MELIAKCIVKTERSGCVPLHRSLLRRSGFPIFEAIEEHWVTEDGHPVAPESLDLTTHLSRLRLPRLRFLPFLTSNQLHEHGVSGLIRGEKIPS